MHNARLYVIFVYGAQSVASKCPKLLSFQFDFREGKKVKIRNLFPPKSSHEFCCAKSYSFNLPVKIVLFPSGSKSWIGKSNTIHESETNPT